MSSLIIKTIISFLRIVPARLRLGFMRLCLETESRDSSEQSLKNLLLLEVSVRQYINYKAIAYESGIHPKHRLTKYHEFFVSRIHDGEHVLDIGCGIGAVANSIAKTGAYVKGIDINKEIIIQAQQRYQHPRLTFLVGEIPKIKPPGHFDVLVLSNILEHIEDRVFFLNELQQAFQPKRLLIRVPMFDRDWIVPLRQELGMFPFSDSTHFCEYTMSSFKEEMERAGLLIVYTHVQWGELWAEVRAQG